MYTLVFKKKAIKALTKVNEPYYSSIMDAINELAENPRPNGCKKLTGRDGYRIRVGTYRIIYDIFEDTLIVAVVNLGSRGDIYED
jgi:mRNA interferase RelE/StbE